MLNNNAVVWANFKIRNNDVSFFSYNEGEIASKDYGNHYLCKIVKNADISNPKDWAYDISLNGKLSFQKLYNLVEIANNDGEFEVAEVCRDLINKISKTQPCCS